MSGLFRSVAFMALVGLPAVCVGAESEQSSAAQAQPARPRASEAVRVRSSVPASNPAPVLLTASLSSGWIEGVVTDDRSRPIGGAAVTAQGRDFLLVETDGTGRFSIRSVPAGTYLLRVQGRGFSASRREFVQVLASRGTRHDVRLRRTADVDPAPGEARVIAAGMALSQVTASQMGAEPLPAEAAAPVESEPHDHSSAAWRMRHVTLTTPSFLSFTSIVLVWPFNRK